MQGREYKAANTTFSAKAKKALFSTGIAGAYTDEAAVGEWIRTCQLDRGKRFIVRDEYKLKQVKDAPTTINFITCCQVSEKEPGILELKGDKFALQMKFDNRKVTPAIEFIKVTDNGLRRYWPDGITRIVFTLMNPATKGKNEIVIEN